MSVHLLSIYINELDNRIEDTLLHLQMTKQEETAWTKDKVRFQNKHDKLQNSVANVRTYTHSRILCYVNDLDQVVKGGGFEKDTRVRVSLQVEYKTCLLQKAKSPY